LIDVNAKWYSKLLKLLVCIRAGGRSEANKQETETGTESETEIESITALTGSDSDIVLLLNLFLTGASQWLCGR